MVDHKNNLHYKLLKYFFLVSFLLIFFLPSLIYLFQKKKKSSSGRKIYSMCSSPFQKYFSTLLSFWKTFLQPPVSSSLYYLYYPVIFIFSAILTIELSKTITAFIPRLKNYKSQPSAWRQLPRAYSLKSQRDPEPPSTHTE